MPAVHIYQILNHYTPREALDPGFLVLDNSSNERPDWYEYWPMRKFLLNEPLDEEAFYGFLSPKFEHKTNLTSARVREFIERADRATDVFLFSPSIHNSAYYLNVFEHGESEHPGLAGVARRFLGRIDPQVNLDELVSDSRNTVHSNYFVARPRFWRAWLEVNERLFEIAETRDDELGAQLRAPTAYRGHLNVEMKIFVMERIATWLLTRDASFRAQARDPFAARARIYKLPLAVVCDALKIAYLTQGRGQYKDVFLMVRRLRGLLNLQVRVGARLGLARVRPSLRSLKSYWRSSAR
ncbi:MAG TPA: hypothetical protein VME42_17830 [Steroidobacteraceae bacterium]|nr:hypothetical protein [Steroidobacteraceae bacterium]